MAIPIYLWLEDDSGMMVRGSVDVKGREGSIEISNSMHSVMLPIDDYTGKIMGKRMHSGYAFTKEIDSSSPYLYQALISGKRFRKASFSFYTINYAGQEEEYFRVTLEHVTVSSISSLFLDIKEELFAKYTHHELVELMYEKISWHYLDGNIVHSDSWSGGA